MSYEEKQQPSAKTHSISMENRTKLSVEGSISELSYEDKAPSGGFWQKLFG